MKYKRKRKSKCTICKAIYKKEEEKVRKYKTIDGKIVCEDCYNEVKRLSTVRKMSLEEAQVKYYKLIHRIRRNEIKGKGKIQKKKIVCCFCKTLKNINLINDRYLCDDCDNLIEELMVKHKKKRTQIEGMMALEFKAKRKRDRNVRKGAGNKTKVFQ